jgi:signal transduction histidine kinase
MGRLLKECNYIRVSLPDRGRGIPAEYLNRIFDSFFTTNREGNGLRLVTSFSIARNHSGLVGVESELTNIQVCQFILL